MAREGLLAAAGLPLRHRERAGAAWPGSTLERVSEAINGGGTVALVGKRGTGKTQMACDLIKAATLERGRSAWYTRADDLFDAMRAEFDGKGRGQVMRRAARIGLLVIDELQVRFDSAFEDRELTRLIDKRYGALLPSVLIANLTPEAFWKSVGPSIGDRMREGGTVIVCDWESFRSKQ
jgi:DNA replication protein DnaC